jgi:hypothetical protein
MLTGSRPPSSAANRRARSEFPMRRAGGQRHGLPKRAGVRWRARPLFWAAANGFQEKMRPEVRGCCPVPVKRKKCLRRSGSVGFQWCLAVAKVTGRMVRVWLRADSAVRSRRGARGGWNPRWHPLRPRQRGLGTQRGSREASKRVLSASTGARWSEVTVLVETHKRLFLFTRAPKRMGQMTNINREAPARPMHARVMRHHNVTIATQRSR